MKFYYILILLFGMQAAYAMEAPPSRKRSADEPEEQTPAKVAYTEPSTQERSAFEALPNEVKKQILEYLLTATGGTADIRLAKAADNIRNFMSLGLKNKAFEPFLNDENLHGYLITQLAKRYAGNNAVKAALALRTDAGGRWLLQQRFESAYILPHMLVALTTGDTSAVLYLLRYSHLDERDSSAALIVAAGEGYLPMVERLLAVPFINVNAADHTGATPLTNASEKGHLPIVERLLAVPGLRVNKDREDGATALLLAAENGYLPIVERLLAVPGIDVNKQESNGFTSLVVAAQKGHLSVAQRLLEVPSINVNEQDTSGFTVLMTAAEKGDLKLVEKLLAMPGIDVNHQAEEGETALSIAQNSESPNKDAIIKLLKAHGAVE